MVNPYVIILVLIVVVVLLPFLCRLCYDDCKEMEEANDQEAGGREGAGTRAGEELQLQLSPAARSPPLVCTYRRADGWRESSCGVCLADLQDGEAIRVLPACLHYFHAACVGEWLLAHATCPLCRAPLTTAGTVVF